MSSQILAKKIIESLDDDNFLLPNIIHQSLHYSETLGLAFAHNFESHFTEFTNCISHFVATFLEVYANFIDIPVYSQTEIKNHINEVRNNIHKEPHMEYIIKSTKEASSMNLVVYASSLVGYIFVDINHKKKTVSSNITEKQKSLINNIFFNAIIYAVAHTLSNKKLESDFSTGFIQGSMEDKNNALNNGLELLRKRNEVLYWYILHNHKNDKQQNHYALSLWSLTSKKETT